MLKTERLLLRPWCETMLKSCSSSRATRRWARRRAGRPHAGVEESAAVIRDVLMMSDSFAIIERATGALVGAMALKHPEISELARPGEAELGYWVGVPYWGCGYATEAARAAVAYGFGELGLTAIWAGYYEGNERSHRVQEKLGFEFQYRRESDVELLGEHRIEVCQRLVPQR